jgi:hypothetical protein
LWTLRRPRRLRDKRHSLTDLVLVKINQSDPERANGKHSSALTISVSTFGANVTFPGTKSHSLRFLPNAKLTVISNYDRFGQKKPIV